MKGKTHSLETKLKIRNSRAAASLAQTRDYSFADKDGKIFAGRGLKDFCIQHGLNYGSMNSVLNGTRNQCFGWTVTN